MRSLPDLTVLLTEIFVGIHTHSPLVCILSTGSRGRRQSVEKNLINNLWSAGESIGNKYTNEFIDKQSTPKKNYPFYFVSISIGKFNISPTGILYVMPSVFLFVHRYIHR
jgi:hypothetical protein